MLTDRSIGPNLCLTESGMRDICFLFLKSNKMQDNRPLYKSKPLQDDYFQLSSAYPIVYHNLQLKQAVKST